jgi:hypothetical protein
LLQGFTAPTPLTRQGLSSQGRRGAVTVCCIGRRGELHDIARFGEKKLALLRPFLPFADGGHRMIASAIYRHARRPSPRALLRRMIARLMQTPVEVIAIDGKTMRSSGHKKNSKAPLHMVSALAAGRRTRPGEAGLSKVGWALLVSGPGENCGTNDEADSRLGASRSNSSESAAHNSAIVSIIPSNQTGMPRCWPFFVTALVTRRSALGRTIAKYPRDGGARSFYSPSACTGAAFRFSRVRLA